MTNKIEKKEPEEGQDITKRSGVWNFGKAGQFPG